MLRNMGGALKMDAPACSWSLVFAAALCIVPHATSVLVFQSISPVDGTVSGGTVVTLTGTDFEQLHPSNTTVFFGDIQCSLLWDTLSSTEVACLTAPYPSAWEGGYSSQLLVTLTVNGTEYSSGSRYMYRWRLTPEIHFIRPLATQPGSIIAFTGAKLPSDPLDIEAVRFIPGGGVCNTLDPSTNQPYGSYVRDNRTWIQCRVEAPPGIYNMSVLVAGVGYAWQHSHAFYLGPAGELTMFEVFPDVHSVTPQVSHLVGNELLTIEGVGFSSNMADLLVDIDGLTCTVVNATETTIQCVTDSVTDGHPATSDNGTFPLTSLGHRYKGARGVAIRHYYDISGDSVEDLFEADSYPEHPDAFALFPSFEPGADRRFNNYGEVYDAFFMPVTSEEHLLWTTGNARTELYFAEGANSSLLERIAQSTRDGNTYEVYNRRFFNDWSRSGALAQLSESVTLYSNKTYMLQGVMKEDSGVDFMKVGFLLPASHYMWNESKLVNREEQHLQTLIGYNYERQQLDVSVDMTAVNESTGNLPRFTLVWDRWETGPMFAFNVTFNDVYDALSSLFLATCKFSNTSDVVVFEDRIFDFESGNNEGWVRWDNNGRHPEAIEYEAFCQRYSLEVYDGRALAFETASRRFSLLTYPYLCMAYKIPNDTQVNIAVRVTGYGWFYTPVAEGENSTTLSPLLPHFNNGSTHPIVNNDQWNFTCCDVEALVRSGLGLDNSTEAEVEGLGFFADDTALFQNAFHVDQLSLSSVERDLIERIPPARPGGVSLFDLARITETDEVPDLVNTTVRNISIQFEVRPSLCEVDIPLIQAVNVSGNGVLRLEVTRTRTQREPVEGAVAVKLGNVTTRSFSHDDDIRRIKMIINEDLENITGLLNVWSGRRPNDYAHQFCSGRNIFIRYDELTGRQPVFEGVSSLLRGRIRVFTRWPGGFFQRPIPGHMLRTVESQPQLHVTVNNVTASCSGNMPFFTPQPTPFAACSFVYRLATPPENITGLRDCPLPWRLHWHAATDKVWNITMYEVVYWVSNDTSSEVTVNVTGSAGDEDSFELDLSHLELGREYLFKIKSHSVEGPGDFSGIFPVYTHRCLPSPPSNLALSRLHCPERAWQLMWDTPTHFNWNLTKFEVLVEVESGLPSSPLTIEVAIVTPSQISYSVTLTALDVQRRYNVQVRTFGEEGPGDYSEEIVAYAPDKCLPSPPSNISVSRECPFPWKLSWIRSEPAEWNLTSFEVTQRSSHSAEAVQWSVEVMDQRQLTFEVSLFSLNANEEYWFEVRSVGLDGAGNYSKAVHFRAQICVPPPPLLGVSRVCPGPWRLRWLHDLNPSWNVTRYDVIWEEGRERVGLAEVTVVSAEEEVYEVVLSGLNVTSEYAIRVRGVNRDGPGNYSDVLVYRPHACVPHSPTIVDVVQTDLTTVTLSWTMPEVTNGNITHFEVILSDESGTMKERSAVVAATATQTVYNATFERLSEFQRYSYQVRAFSEDGPGNYSDAETLTLVDGCGVGRYKPPRCLTRCEERCGRGNPCHAFSGTCTCNSCWKGALCSGAVSSLCFEDYIRAVKKEEKLLMDFGNSIPEPPIEYLYRFISEAMQDVPSNAFQVSALSFDVQSREDILARPLAMVSLVVDYEADRERAQAGISRLHQLVHSGLWRATLIQRDHPSTLPMTSTIIVNV